MLLIVVASQSTGWADLADGPEALHSSFNSTHLIIGIEVLALLLLLFALLVTAIRKRVKCEDAEQTAAELSECMPRDKGAAAYRVLLRHLGGLGESLLAVAVILVPYGLLMIALGTFETVWPLAEPWVLLAIFTPLPLGVAIRNAIRKEWLRVSGNGVGLVLAFGIVWVITVFLAIFLSGVT
jgi:hypothetical protein